MCSQSSERLATLVGNILDSAFFSEFSSLRSRLWFDWGIDGSILFSPEAKEIEELKTLDLSKVHQENKQLKKTLEQIKTEYQPIKKKIHNGSTSRRKKHGR